MKELTIFKNEEFGEVRVIEKNGEPWFVGKDVADILAYSETNAMTKRLDSQDVISDKLAGMNMRSILINESGLYDAIFGSKLPQAKQFKRWVTSEVLPALRKTGKYEIPKSKAQMTDYQKTMTKTRVENTKIRKAQLLTKLANQYKGTTYEQVLNSYATKELTGEHILPLPLLEKKTYSATEIGNILGVSANMIGRLSKKHNLKTEQYGKWFHDKAKHSAKEVPTFRYYDNVIPVLKEIINQEVA